MKTQRRKVHPLLKLFCPIVDCVADLFGSDCEVVLHDITQPEKSIIKIRNGHVTGRKVGDPLTDLGLKMIKDAEKGLEMTGNYNPRNQSGHLLKSNAIAVKDTKGALIGILCINLDATRMQGIQNVLRRISSEIGDFVLAPVTSGATSVREEHFEKDLLPMLQEIIDKTVKGIAKSPDSLSPMERQEIIGAMDDKGVFFMKKAVHGVANSLGISIPSVYRCLDKARRIRQRTKDGGTY
jgi:predicted transcriptional regulator YheO